MRGRGEGRGHISPQQVWDDSGNRAFEVRKTIYLLLDTERMLGARLPAPQGDAGAGEEGSGGLD